MQCYQQITSSFYPVNSIDFPPNLLDYDKILIAFSGGKDSMAAWLATLERLVVSGLSWSQISERVEFWHHLIDGREGSKLMDWPVSESYAKKVAEAFGVPIYFSWKVGGFEGEMTRDDRPTAPTRFETPAGEIKQAGGAGSKGTRLKFPQVSANLQTRWCSSYLKIDVMAISIRNQDRFEGLQTLVITGERAEESSQRATYKFFEPHRSDKRESPRLKRLVDHWRPVHEWLEGEVWAIIKEYEIRAHPAYYLGFSRVSCQKCIFGGKNAWATNQELDPAGVEKIAIYEEQFETTIHRTKSVRELVSEGESFVAGNKQDAKDSQSEDYKRSIFMDNWQMPAGAFSGGSCGPS